MHLSLYEFFVEVGRTLTVETTGSVDACGLAAKVIRALVYVFAESFLTEVKSCVALASSAVVDHFAHAIRTTSRDRCLARIFAAQVVTLLRRCAIVARAAFDRVAADGLVVRIASEVRRAFAERLVVASDANRVLATRCGQTRIDASESTVGVLQTFRGRLALSIVQTHARLTACFVRFSRLAVGTLTLEAARVVDAHCGRVARELHTFVLILTSEFRLDESFSANTTIVVAHFARATVATATATLLATLVEAHFSRFAVAVSAADICAQSANADFSLQAVGSAATVLFAASILALVPSWTRALRAAHLGKW